MVETAQEALNIFALDVHEQKKLFKPGIIKYPNFNSGLVHKFEIPLLTSKRAVKCRELL